jgi:hypothetical protein
VFSPPQFASGLNSSFGYVVEPSVQRAQVHILGFFFSMIFENLGNGHHFLGFVVLRGGLLFRYNTTIQARVFIIKIVYFRMEFYDKSDKTSKPY